MSLPKKAPRVKLLIEGFVYDWKCFLELDNGTSKELANLIEEPEDALVFEFLAEVTPIVTDFTSVEVGYIVLGELAKVESVVYSLRSHFEGDASVSVVLEFLVVDFCFHKILLLAICKSRKAKASPPRICTLVEQKGVFLFARDSAQASLKASNIRTENFGEL